MGPTPFYGARAEKTQKANFAMKQTNICRLSGDIIIITNQICVVGHDGNVYVAQTLRRRSQFGSSAI